MTRSALRPTSSTPLRQLISASSGAALVFSTVVMLPSAAAAQDSAAAAAKDSAAQAARADSIRAAAMACKQVKMYIKQVAADSAAAAWKRGTLVSAKNGQMQVNLPMVPFNANTAPDSIRTLANAAGPSCKPQLTPQDIMQVTQAQLQKPRPVIGVQIQPVTAKDTAGLGLSTLTGLLVKSVTPNFGAQAAGIAAGDVILSVDDKPVNSVPELLQLSAAWKDGGQVNIEVARKGAARQKLAVTAKMSK